MHGQNHIKFLNMLYEKHITRISIEKDKIMK